MPSTVRGLFVVTEPVQVRSEEARRNGVSVRPKGQATPIVKLHGLANFFDAEDPSVSSYFDGSDLLDVTYVRSSGLVLRMDYWVTADRLEIRQGDVTSVGTVNSDGSAKLTLVVNGEEYDVDLSGCSFEGADSISAFVDMVKVGLTVRFSFCPYSVVIGPNPRPGYIRAIEVLDENGDVESGLPLLITPWEPTDKSEMDEPASFAADCLSLEEALVDEQAALNAPAEEGPPAKRDDYAMANGGGNTMSSLPWPLSWSADRVDSRIKTAGRDRPEEEVRKDLGVLLGHASTLSGARADAVDHPAHYGGADNPYEAIKVIEAWELGFPLGNAVKYIARAGKKDDTKTVEDLRKARWYLDRHISNLEKAK